MKSSIALIQRSKITFSLIRSSANKCKTYVANGVSEMQTLNIPNRWYHVKSTDNPADIISRGVLPEQLKDLCLNIVA